jgi:cephalosporin-C deacetylase-like acetyl esterase
MTPQDLHRNLAKGSKVLPLSYDENKDFELQKHAIHNKLLEILAMPKKKISPVPIVEFESTINDGYDEIKFTFESEPNFFVPAHLILPKKRKDKLPVVICLEGHSSGMHRSLRRVKYSKDTLVHPDGVRRDVAIQAIEQGYASVVMEQRGFGELKGINRDGGVNCFHMAMQAMMLNQTLLGERCFDISRLIDALTHFDQLDLDKIGITGGSGGGTASFYATCV